MATQRQIRTKPPGGKSRRLILGGAFNPAHIGHLRMAIEARETLGFDGVDWLPCAAPNHKPTTALLPFALRAELIRAVIGADPAMRVETIEDTLPTPSYTYRTLQALDEREPEVERGFALGQAEFLKLHRWVEAREVAARAEIIVALRDPMDLAVLADGVRAGWPESREIDAPEGAVAAFELLPGRRAVVFEPPRIEISSTLLRERWLAGRSLDGLTTPAALEIMQARRSEIDKVWSAAKADSDARRCA